ncbi:MAG: type II secretion system protein [Armatimonadetes bacterium]|nr:type II secretion system protein [Armatimonadota bacterium]
MLVVIAIVAILAAVLFPVFSRARDQAKATVCLSNFKQVSTSVLLYQVDYDDRYVPAKYSTDANADSSTDRTWVQLILPYGKSFALFKCPGDFSVRPTNESLFNADALPNDSYARYYRASMRSNLGYNYLYFAPLFTARSRIPYSVTRSTWEVQDPSGMLVFGDSVHSIDSSGKPVGGGSYLIVPPCRYANAENGTVDTFLLDSIPNTDLYTGSLDWGPIGNGVAAVASGGLWPWHSDRLTTVYADGHARRITLDQAAEGCEALPMWAGLISDRSKYRWDFD